MSTIPHTHSVEKRENHCHAIFFRQINLEQSSLFRQSSLFSEKFLWRNFCEKMMAVKFRNFHTVTLSVEKREIFSQQKHILSNQLLVTYLVKPLLSRNFYQKCVRENFRNFHTVQSILEITEIYSHRKIFRQIIYLVLCLVKTLLSRNFCQKKW